MWKIAIIDDDRSVLEGMRAVIPWAELEAEWAGEAMNGEEGLKLIEQCQPDIVITDIYMPVLNGLDMLERVNKEKFQGKVIILSGYADFEYARKAIRLGILDYLNKPITVQTIREVLSRTISVLEEELEKKHRNEMLEEKLRQYEPFVEKEWIKSVASGSVAGGRPHDDASAVVPPSCRHWNDVRHAVIGIEMIRTDRIVSLSSKDINLFRFAVSNMIYEIAKEEWPDSHYVELFGHYSAIILHSPDEPADIDAACRFACRVVTSVRDYLQITLHAGIGTFKQGCADIAVSTEEAFQAIYSKASQPVQGIELYRYVKNRTHEGPSYPIAMRPIKFYQEMAEAVKFFQEPKARGVIDDYFEQWNDRTDISIHNLEMLGTELWAIFGYALFEVGVPLDDIVPLTEVNRELKSIATLDRLREWLYDKVRLICQYRSGGDNIKHRQVVEFITQYIHEHYSEPITILDLADKIHISRNYLSHIFKKAMGESFNSYVTRVRMEKAKEMILEGKHLIYEIAERVGYKNVAYFSSSFKKYTGVNPTDLYKVKS